MMAILIGLVDGIQDDISEGMLMASMMILMLVF